MMGRQASGYYLRGKGFKEMQPKRFVQQQIQKLSKALENLERLEAELEQAQQAMTAAKGELKAMASAAHDEIACARASFAIGRDGDGDEHLSAAQRKIRRIECDIERVDDLPDWWWC